MKLVLFSHDEDFNWAHLAKELADGLGDQVSLEVRASHAILVVHENLEQIRPWLREHHPDLRLMSAGSAIEIFKEKGLPRDVVRRFQLEDMAGSHAIGHTRMATESAVTTEHSHPFSTGMDLCLVHNGSLSNHNRLRQVLKREGGIEFQTDNDTEVAAGYLTWRMDQGASLHEALEAGIADLDGFYTFCVGTKDGFAVLRDPDRLQARGAGRDGRLGRHGHRVPRHRPPAGGRGRQGLGAGAGAGLQLGPGLMIEVDLRQDGVRALNQRLHALRPDSNERAFRVTNPMGGHSIAVGIAQPVEVAIDGHVGFYCGGMNQEATITVHGHAGPGVGENMMSGRIHVTGNCSQGAGASGRGGMLIVDGDASSRCGISMKGISIVVKGSVGHMSAFMGQSGNLVVCGDCGRDLGDLLYEARIYVRGDGREPGGRLRRETDDAAPSRQARPPARRGRGRPRSGYVPALRLGAPALPFPRRPRRRLLRTLSMARG